MSKKQKSIETKSFGSVFTAMQLYTACVRGLKYKLRMMGIACTDPIYVFGDNQSVLTSTTVLKSSLKRSSIPSTTMLSVRELLRISEVPHTSTLTILLLTF